MNPRDLAPPSSAQHHGIPRLNVVLVVAFVLLGIVGALSLFSPFDAVWDAPGAFAVTASIAAVLAMAGAVTTMVVADRHDLAELGLVGTGMLAMAVMWAGHAVVTPDAVYEPNEAFALASLLAAPAFALGALPAVLGGTRFGRWVGRRWRDWSLLGTLAAFIVAFGFAGLPDVWSAPARRGPVTVAVSVLAALALWTIANRFHRRSVTSGSPVLLGLSVSLGCLGLTAMAPMADEYALGFWGLRALGLVSVIGVAVSSVVLSRQVPATHAMFSSTVRVDPYLGVDLAVSPVVRHFMFTESERREFAGTADIALQVADRMHLSFERRRNLSLAAVLHDVGKSMVPAAILAKPGALTPDEFDTIQEHAALGAEIVAADPALAACAPIVRAHHERVDGAGYPDGLAGEQIPLEARIIAACDAFEAITHDRQYRAGLGVGMSLAILRANAGQQWDPEVVGHLVLVVAASDLAPTVPSAVVEVPDDVGELLARVDCEI